MKIIKRSLSVLLMIGISACTTTNSTFTTPYSTANTSSSSSGDGYDREKAASTRLSLGLRYLAQGDYDKAKFNLDKALNHTPNSDNVLRGYAWYYEQVNEIKLAEEYYQKALKINRRNPALLNQYGVFLCRQDKLEESLAMFEASVKILKSKDVSSTYENAATCNFMAGKKDLAEQLYRKALNHNPEQRDSLLGMARIEFSKERYSRSRSYLTRYEKLAPHNARSLWLAIRTESHLGNMDAVASYALKLEQRFPDSEETELYLDSRNQWLK
jgi:type IV pilus assembly protein PilF